MTFSAGAHLKCDQKPMPKPRDIFIIFLAGHGISHGMPAGEVFVEGVKSDLAGLVKRLIEAFAPQIDKLPPQ